MAYDVCIRGSGIVGKTLALLLARAHLRVALVERSFPAKTTPDVRAYALTAPSRELLQSIHILDVDEAKEAKTSTDTANTLEAKCCTAVQSMKIVDQSDSRSQSLDLHKTPESQALAWIVDVPYLEEKLHAACANSAHIDVLESPCPAPLQAVCEGKGSRTGADFAFPFTPQAYHHSAIAARLRTEQGHQQTAYQWFHEGRILALLPMGGNAGNEWALIWSMPNTHVKDLLDLDASDFAERIHAVTHETVGLSTLQSERLHWPLHTGCASQWVTQNGDTTFVLLGDAAHSVHPLAGQGLNLGLADAGLLAQTLAERSQGRDYWRPLNDPKPLQAYARQRLAAAQAMTGLCDGLQQLFAMQNPVLQNLRQCGLRAFQATPCLQRRVLGVAESTASVLF